MRILTVRQPWAWAIIHGGKDVENRVRNIAGSYRGPVAIHVGLRPIGDAMPKIVARSVGEWCRANPDIPHEVPHPLGAEPSRGNMLSEWYANRGAIIGVVDLADVHFGPFAERWDAEAEHNARCTPWAEPDMVHLVLRNPRPLSEPIPYKGALGLRTIPAELQARIEAQI